MGVRALCAVRPNETLHRTSTAGLPVGAWRDRIGSSIFSHGRPALAGEFCVRWPPLSMTTDDTPFQFTAPWYELGIATPARLAMLQEIWARGVDRHAEHYRWRAFRTFLAEHRPITPELAAALYELGATDADVAMGESIMHEVAALPECPESVVKLARASGRKHLVQAATRDRGSTAC